MAVEALSHNLRSKMRDHSGCAHCYRHLHPGQMEQGSGEIRLSTPTAFLGDINIGRMVLTRSQCATGSESFEAWKIFALYNQSEHSTSGVAQYSVRSEPQEQKASVTSFRLFAKMSNCHVPDTASH